MELPSGEQYTIEHGGLRATITEVGATLREFTLDGAPVLWGFPEETMSAGGRGQVLAPWPNRLADGSYVFRGTPGTAALNEPDRHNAIHGLVRWLNWTARWQESALVEMTCVLPPQPAYPYRLHLSITYVIAEGALHVRTRAEGEDRRVVPFGLGFHPYFLGNENLAGARLELDAGRRLLLDQRGLPCGDEPLSGDLASLASPGGVALDGLVLDDCFTDLHRGDDNQAVVRFHPGTGPIASVEVGLDPSYGYVMCFTGDTLALADRRRAIAIEPMTCPPNAFATGDSLIELGEDSAFEATFSIRPLAAPKS